MVQNTPSITFLNMTGDVTISWDAQNEEAILALVQQKMDAGFSFFILKPRVGGLFGNKKVELTQIEQARKAGSIVVPDKLADTIIAQLGDAELEAQVAAGAARVVSREKPASIATTHRATTPQEVVRHQSVAVRAVVGG